MKKVFQILFIGLLLLGCSDDDTSNNTQQNAIAGTWQIFRIQIEPNEFSQQAPEREVISIIFQNNGDFSGITTHNTFGGRYEVRGDVLTMLEFFTTEALDTPFGALFYGAIDAAQLPEASRAQFDIDMPNENELTLRFAESGIMELRR